MLFRHYRKLLKDEAMETGNMPEDPESSLAMGNLEPEELGMEMEEPAGVGFMSPEESMARFEEARPRNPLLSSEQMPQEDVTAESAMSEPEEYDIKMFLSDLIAKRQEAREMASKKYQMQQQELSDRVFGTKHSSGEGY